MAFFNFFILLVVIILEIGLLSVKGFVLLERNTFIKNRNSDLSPEAHIPDHVVPLTTIRHYARHGLCGTFEGKRRFYNAMKTKFCGISLSMIQDVVIDLCRHKKHMLDKWVKELFDTDRDGYISHFEKRHYT
ncbi:uncharacterized protein LOC123538603 [Mercenaria mercenaria]|uniref:uncharacterized protein LOC123538603 n=1 Tax=Mercenaria mercenaria TaxID=6596 RepID=UPI00234F279D|nr:uncharacterized protein LOC123538603 [Mercenaria mercenaria]